MHFRYDFNEKLDFSKFKKSAEFYISTQPSIKYDFYLKDFRVGAYIQLQNNNQHKLELKIEEKRKKISSLYDDYLAYEFIIPSVDSRFQEVEIFEKFPKDSYMLEEFSNSVIQTINTICQFLKFVHKINGMSTFT